MKLIFIITVGIFCSTVATAQDASSKAITPAYLADSLYQILQKDPGQFCRLVQSFSEDPGSIEHCGVYDYSKGSNYVSPIAKLVRKKRNYEMILPPARTEYGYHIIQPLGVRGDQIKFRHILISAPPE